MVHVLLFHMTNAFYILPHYLCPKCVHICENVCVLQFFDVLLSRFVDQAIFYRFCDACRFPCYLYSPNVLNFCCKFFFFLKKTTFYFFPDHIILFVLLILLLLLLKQKYLILILRGNECMLL